MLRQIIQQFNENIANYRKNFVSFKFRQLNFDNVLFFESIAFRSNRFRFQSSIIINRVFFSITFISNLFFAFLFLSVIKRPSSTSKFSMFRIMSMLIFSIESIDNNQQNSFFNNEQNINTHQQTIDFR